MATMQIGQFGVIIKYAKTMRKTFVQTHESCSMQKTARKNSLYSKNESIFKMAKNGHNAKAIAHAKWPVWVKIQYAKNMGKTFVKHIKVVLCKKRIEKTANIRKMRAF